MDLVRGILYRRGSAERETSKRRPALQLTPRVRAHMSRWLSIDAKPETRPIIHYNGSPILKMKRAWAKTIKEAGLGRDVTPHVLRHSCASHALWGRSAKGARPATKPLTIWDVAGLIGADATTVQKIYGHHRLDVEQRMAG